MSTSRGLYVPAGVDRSLPEQRILEQAARLPRGAAVSGWAALRIRGARYFDGLAVDGRTQLPVPLLVPTRTRLTARPGAAVVRSDDGLAGLEVVHGVPCVPPVRAVYDQVRLGASLREAVVVVDMAVAANLASLREIDEAIAEWAGNRGIELLRRARALAVDRSASPMESRFRLIWVLDAGLPTPRCNWPVADREGRYVGKPDLLDEHLGIVGEYDGRDHRGRERHRQDVGRADGFARVGLECATVVGGDIADRALVVRRIRDAIERRRSSTRPRAWLLKANPPPLWR